MENRILLITRNFPPLVGGMERFVWNVYKQLTKEYICDVVGPRGCNEYLKKVEYTNNFSPSQSLPGFLIAAFCKSIYLATKNKYSLCIAGSGVTSPMANIIGKLYSIPVITFVYGLDLVVKNSIYQSFFVPFIKYSDKVITISESTKNLTLQKGVSTNQIEILYPGVDIKTEFSNTIDFRARFNIHKENIILSVGRLIPRKGIAEFIEFSLPKIIHDCPDTVFVIIGGEATNALKKDYSVIEEIKKVVHDKKLADHVILTGRVDDQTLWSAYQQADLFVFPLRDEPGDIEGFGMVAVEAASFGLPTIAFAVGGVIDAIEDNKSGFLIPPGSYDEFSDIVIECLRNKGQKITRQNCIAHAQKFTWDNFGNGLREICRIMVL